MQYPIVLVLLGSIFAAVGQVLLKLGVTGATEPIDFINLRLLSGFLMYALGSIFWVISLSRLPLSRVYPFTVLTFVIVYAASACFLGERLSAGAILGSMLVLAGLIVIVYS